MSTPPSPDAQKRLEAEQNIWLSSVQPDGRPHLIPVWFVWRGGRLYTQLIEVTPAKWLTW
jgi:hypothetical protein